MEVSAPLIVIAVLGALGGIILSLFLLWMLRQQKFLHELFLTLRNLEQRNREAQRDLFLILGRYLGLPVPARQTGLRKIPPNGKAEGAPHEKSRVLSYKGSETKGDTSGLTLDEVRLLIAVATGEESSPKSLSGILKSGKGFYDLEAKLSSLRNKGFIFYSDLSDVVAILPKGRHYLGLLRS